MKSRIRLGLSLGTLVVMLASGNSGARADLVISSVVGGAPTGVNYANFDDLSLGGSGGPTAVSGPSGTILNVSFTGDAAAVVNSLSGRYAAPFLSENNALNFGNTPTSGPDASTYLSSGVGSVVLDFSNSQNYFGLLWGSVDGYNKLEFFNGATSVGFLTGADVATSANGDQGVNGTYYVNINSTLGFNRVVASATSYAFEFDNVAFSPTAVPEPGSLAMLSLGGLTLAGGLWNRRRIRKASV